MSTLTDTTPARVIRTVRGRPTSDGAGVKLTREQQLDVLSRTFHESV